MYIFYHDENHLLETAVTIKWPQNAESGNVLILCPIIIVLAPTNNIAPSFLYKPHATHNSLICFDEGLMLETSAFKSLYGGQFISTQLIKPNYLECTLFSLYLVSLQLIFFV